MFINFILLPLAVVGVFLLFLKYIDWKSTNAVYNIKTGEKIQGNNFFTLFYYLFFGNKKESITVQMNRTLDGKEVACSWFLYKMLVQVRTPELAKQVLSDTETFIKMEPFVFKEGKEFLGVKQVVSIDGNDWKRHRNVLSPAFFNLDIYEKIFEQKTKLVLQKIREKGEIVENATEFTTSMALDILGLSIFGFDFDSISGSSNKELKAYHHMMDCLNSTQKAFYYILKELLLGSYSKNPSMDESNKVFNDLIFRLIKSSKDKKEGREFSMLDMMVASQNQEEGLSDQEIRDNVSIFFLAGHETTANALAFAIYNLAKHQDIQEKLRNEIKNEIPKGQPLKYEHVKNLEYLSNFIKENMRMFPPVFAVPAKIASKDTQLGGYFIPKGQLISVNIYAIQNSKETFKDPENFRPERWSKEEQAKTKIPHHAWIPFSSGSRVCIGNNFSLMEQKIFLGELLTNYKIEQVDGPFDVEISPSSSLFQTPVPRKLKFIPIKN